MCVFENGIYRSIGGGIGLSGGGVNIIVANKLYKHHV